MKKFRFLTVVMIIVFACYFYYSVGVVQNAGESEKFEILADAIVRSAVQCYAIEGFYPPNIEYLEENYGLVVDHDKYFVFYNVFASNIMPDVNVYLK
jgi:hypothetical protein